LQIQLLEGNPRRGSVAAGLKPCLVTTCVEVWGNKHAPISNLRSPSGLPRTFNCAQNAIGHHIFVLRTDGTEKTGSYWWNKTIVQGQTDSGGLIGTTRLYRKFAASPAQINRRDDIPMPDFQIT